MMQQIHQSEQHMTAPESPTTTARIMDFDEFYKLATTADDMEEVNIYRPHVWDLEELDDGAVLAKPIHYEEFPLPMPIESTRHRKTPSRVHFFDGDEESVTSGTMKTKQAQPRKTSSLPPRLSSQKTNYIFRKSQSEKAQTTRKRSRSRSPHRRTNSRVLERLLFWRSHQQHDDEQTVVAEEDDERTVATIMPSVSEDTSYTASTALRQRGPKGILKKTRSF